MITVLHHSEQTRRAVIKAYQSGTQVIGWALRGNAGFVYNPNGSPNQTELVNDVQSTLEAIGGNTLLVRGNSGISATQGIFQSTTNGMESDDFVAGQLINDVTFTTGCEVHGPK